MIFTKEEGGGGKASGGKVLLHALNFQTHPNGIPLPFDQACLRPSREGDVHSKWKISPGPKNRKACNSRYRQRSPVYSDKQRHTGWFPRVTSQVPPFKQ